MEWLIVIFGILAAGVLIHQWKPEWIEKVKSKIKSLIKK